jgi:beta-lactamase class A
MTLFKTRRSFLLAAAAAPFALAADGQPPAPDFASLEKELGGRLGVAALDTATGRLIGHRLNERFPMCSTFKMMVAAALLARAGRQPGLLAKHLSLPKSDFVGYSPITEKHVDSEMTAGQLCAATLQYSDNTAANVLMKELGGPAAVTSFARSIGDETFRLDRWETELNSAIPGDERDTTTPLAMARTLQKLLIKDGLPPEQQKQLRDWMLGNTTGDKRIRAGVAADWQVADKTGTGAYGTCNDIAVLYPPARAPIVLAVYTTRNAKEADGRDDIIPASTRAVIAAF